MNNKDDEEADDSINDDDIEGIPPELVQCPACLRRMRKEIFSKHPNVCRKNPTKKRNLHVFDMTQYRSIKSGDKILPVHKVSPYYANKSNNNTSIRPSQTRSAKRDRRADTFVPPVISSFCCPNCKRTFCEKAYDRHVKFCSSKLKQFQQPPSEERLSAQVKLDRRIKFNSNRIPSTLPINDKPTITQKVSVPTEAFCFLSIRKKPSDSLARCPWCSKPYLPNCIHYCRNSKDLFSIHSK